MDNNILPSVKTAISTPPGSSQLAYGTIK